MKHYFIVAGVVLVFLLTLTACRQSPQVDSSKSVLPTSSIAQFMKPQSTIEAETNPVLPSFSVAEATHEEGPNAEVISDSNGLTFNRTIHCNDDNSIKIDATVDTSNVEDVHIYKYLTSDVTESMRTALFQAYWEDRAGNAEYDERNNCWRLRNSDRAGDYYQYETHFASKGIPNEEVFYVE